MSALTDLLPPVGSDPSLVLDAFAEWATAGGRPLYSHQEEAALALAAGEHVVLATPTGSGKSLVAIAGVLLALNDRRRAVWTAPIKALVAEKFFDLVDLLGAQQVGLATGDASINSDAPVLVCTAEVLANNALARGAASDFGFACLDEFHYYADPDRGWAWQVRVGVAMFSYHGTVYFGITGDMTTHFGIAANFTRYALDFCITDAQGRLYRTDGATPEDWYGFGTPILATGDGMVVEMHDGMADNRKGAPLPFDQAAVMKNLKLLLGNYVILDHGNGEYSLFAHLKQGSVLVKSGQRVARGARIGTMGMSGDAFLVHLHYQLQSGDGFDNEGWPAIFNDVQFATGNGWSTPAASAVDSGDIVRTAPMQDAR